MVSGTIHPEGGREVSARRVPGSAKTLPRPPLAIPRPERWLAEDYRLYDDGGLEKDLTALGYWIKPALRIRFVSTTKSRVSSA